MATSTFKATNYSAGDLVASCGAILFDSLGPAFQVCLVHYRLQDEWPLAKGRRNCGESRHAAALRELEEETGYRCHLFPMTMPTRPPASAQQSSVPDQPHHLVVYAEFADRAAVGEGEEAFTSQFFNTDNAMQKLTFAGDRHILKKAIKLTEKQAYAPRLLMVAKSEGSTVDTI
ncbi:uncharacterized protein J7T54_008394 [Emericellopsis cladophorae]|uniref:Nudix hydrolase domain-containing protein n=1 Tax=Emericellopsis cladophorae TaxID=2686198 RepID=A0A9P9Y2B5_9HYPO|nr:uncharacterized protein J7T54_008394 [Emericellopsis cladophorae]KAI6782308.1 hypothetical protein J7T54_008394 [Emericellopsis cladophorae]